MRNTIFQRLHKKWETSFLYNFLYNFPKVGLAPQLQGAACPASRPPNATLEPFRPPRRTIPRARAFSAAPRRFSVCPAAAVLLTFFLNPAGPSSSHLHPPHTLGVNANPILCLNPEAFGLRMRSMWCHCCLKILDNHLVASTHRPVVQKNGLRDMLIHCREVSSCSHDLRQPRHLVGFGATRGLLPTRQSWPSVPLYGRRRCRCVQSLVELIPGLCSEAAIRSITAHLPTKKCHCRCGRGAPRSTRSRACHWHCRERYGSGTRSTAPSPPSDASPLPTSRSTAASRRQQPPRHPHPLELAPRQQ